MICARDLCVSYPDGTPAVKNVRFTIRDGECAALIGANGAGKSSLFLSLVGILPVGGGGAEIGGLPVEKKNLPEIRRRAGLVFQNPDDQLFMPTILEDVLFGPLNCGMARGEAEARAVEALAQLNIGHLAEKTPQKLSGGEKRLCALAGVLAMRPSVMLLDEPSSFLDPAARRRIINVLKELSMTRLVATHDLDLALDLCDRVIVLMRGEIRADGKAKDILTDKKLLEECGLELPLSVNGKERS